MSKPTFIVLTLVTGAKLVITGADRPIAAWETIEPSGSIAPYSWLSVQGSSFQIDAGHATVVAQLRKLLGAKVVEIPRLSRIGSNGKDDANAELTAKWQRKAKSRATAKDAPGPSGSADADAERRAVKAAAMRRYRASKKQQAKPTSKSQRRRQEAAAA